MHYKYESGLAIYDLKLGNKLLNKERDYRHYFYKKELANGLVVKVRADGYYVFDFSQATIGKSIPLVPNVHNRDQKAKDIEEHYYTRNVRIEIIHAFLACLRSSPIEGSKSIDLTAMNFIDNYIICEGNDFDNYDLNSLEDPNMFSSKEYMQLCKMRLENLRDKNIEDMGVVKNAQKVIDDAFKIMDAFIENDTTRRGEALYALAFLYRAAVYHRLGLDIHTVCFLRAVFDWLINYKYPGCNNKNKKIDELLNAVEVKEGTDGYNIFKNFSKVRNRAIHELAFPKSKGDLGTYFCIVGKLLSWCFNTRIDIPITHRFTGLLSSCEPKSD
jgi:hypothetical protein